MCLRVDKEATDKLLASKRKSFTFYKVFEYRGRKYLETYYNYGRLRGPGIIRARGARPVWVTDYDTINIGAIHAYTTKLRVMQEDFGARVVVMPIRVLHKDIVAVGKNDDVCFRKYKITKNAWGIALATLKAKGCTGPLLACKPYTRRKK